MFGELPKLFGRDFALGYFLPVAVFLIVTGAVFDAFGMSSTIALFSQTNPLVDAALAILVAWVGGILLLSANYEIFRLFEGYGRRNPAQLLKQREIKRYNDLKKAIVEIDKQYHSYKSAGSEIPSQVMNDRIELHQRMAEQFPDDEAWLLPTSFGNVVRAFEVYPRVMYGLDDIPGWNRLVAVIPEGFLAQIDSAKSIVDFWLNIIVLSFLFCIEYVVLVLHTQQLNAIWMPLAAAPVAWFAYSRSKSAAIGWGDLVKASFDVFLPKLLETMQFAQPADKVQERQTWTDFSQAVTYRRPAKMPIRTKMQDSKDQGSSKSAEEKKHRGWLWRFLNSLLGGQ